MIFLKNDTLMIAGTLQFKVDKRNEFLKAIKDSNNLVTKVASVYTNTREDRHDLAQEITYQLWKSFSSFNQQSSVNTWMYRVAMNVAIHFLRKNKKRVQTTELKEDLLQLPGDAAYEEDKWKILKAHIDKLDMLDKGIVLLYLEDKTYDEIAEIIGISSTNVGTKLNRIKEKLRHQILK